jgi:radical SAM superfamily enzyme YgiQ (UPF0313 family)
LGVRTVAGGPLVTTSPEDFDDVDYLVLNEAEVTLPAFLRDMEAGQARHLYTGDELADLHTTPIPRWDLIDLKHYAAANLQVSRGCPFDCEFCNITSLFGRRPRAKSAGQVLAELDHLHAAGWRGNVFFVDDNLIGHRTCIRQEILPALIDWMEEHRRPFTYNCQVSIDLADDDALLALVARAGFVAAFVGIETPNEESLAECNKVQNRNRDITASIRKLQHAGLQVQAGFIVGFDSDPPAIFDRLVAFIQESGIVTAMVGLLNAPQGTRLHARLASEGRLLGDISGDNTDSSLNFVPKMDPEVLKRGYRRIIDRVYAPNAHYHRIKGFLREFRPAHPPRRRLQWGDIVTVAKVMVVLGILEQERTYYWRLFFWSLFTRPRMLPMAITLAAFGFHFRKCFERHATTG